MGDYRTIEHTADEGIEWSAADLSALFEKGAAAFAHFVSGAEEGGSSSTSMELDGLDVEDLLVRFLQELLYLFETRAEVFPRCRVVELDPGSGGGKPRIRAELTGRRFDPENDRGRAVVKAVTYHGLAVERTENGAWRARVLFDL